MHLRSAIASDRQCLTNESHARTPHATDRCELATLLLEDPDGRLRVSHAQALLQMRLSLDGPPVAALEAALAEASPIMKLQPAAAGRGWEAGVVRLDRAALRAAIAAAGGKAGSSAAADADEDEGKSEEERIGAAIAAAWPDAEVGRARPGWWLHTNGQPSGWAHAV
jgi:hypothetical protein